MLMRRFITMAAVAITVMAPATAQAAQKDKDSKKDKPTMCERAWQKREIVKKRHGDRAPGRNICRFGIQSKFNKDWEREPTAKEKFQYLQALDRLIDPPVMLNGAGPPGVDPAGTLSPRVGGGHLASIRSCESGGDYGAVDPSGTYRGAYQFDQETWNSVGGSGDPAAASPAEQDKRASMLYQSRGSAPWPVCGG